MRKTTSTLLLLVAMALCGRASAIDPADVKPVKNLILLIPDGTSIATVSTARWYQWYKDPNRQHLAIDPYLCDLLFQRPNRRFCTYDLLLCDRTSEPYRLYRYLPAG